MSLVAKQSHVQAPLAPMSHADAIAIIERAAHDKHLARDLDQLRDRCFSFVNAMMDDVTLKLAEQEKRTPALLKKRPEQPITAISLRAAGQHREEAARKRRELAEAMVMGALANIDNPDWDPRNPGTRRTTDNFFMALLKSAFK